LSFNTPKSIRGLDALSDFLVEQIESLRLVVVEQEHAPLLSQVSIALTQVPLPSQPVVEDECLTPEILLHIAFEVTSQLDKAEESRWLSPEEFSLRDFLV
jgi:hypothetical protein